MMKKTGFALLILALIQTLTLQAQRQVDELSSGWKFSKGEHPLAMQKDFNDSDWATVTVPHDWAIAGPFIADGDANTGKLPWRGEGWYRTHITLTKDDADKQIYLLFDGVMAFPQIFVNGKLAGKWDYGYNSFYINITDFVEFGGKNAVAVHVDTRNHDSRWYPGAGIYRKVQLLILSPVHVDIWGTQITTPIIKPHYTDVAVASTLVNSAAAESIIILKQTILNQLGTAIQSKWDTVVLKPLKSRVHETMLTLTNPHLWSLENPYLYQLKTEIFINDRLVDDITNHFGVREIRITADDGLYLNNECIQIKGVNLHHDLGPLGAAFNSFAQERQLRIMQEMGCNAVRTSHNVPAPELLDLCDRMGILVFNEAFDKYDGKADITDTTDFEQFAQRNIRNFILRDRNHPSVFIWSVGNEMHDVQMNENNGFSKLKTMINYVHRYDATRPVTMANDVSWSANLRHFDFYDVHSWNYNRRYALARQLEPNKAVIISESASTVSTRGFYEFPLPAKKTDFTQSLQVSSYDLNAPWWAEIADDDFMWQQEEPYVAGEFVWTGFDYLGEPTPYNNEWATGHGLSTTEASRSSYFGIVDLCGMPKDRYFLYKSYWNPEINTVHILPHWNWEQKMGDTVPVFVYSNGDCAELFLNGKSQGRRYKNPKSENSVERFRFMWNEVVYEPGELVAVATKEGQEIGKASVKTTGEPLKIRLTPEKQTLSMSGGELSFILIEAVDKQGNPCPTAQNEITIKIRGNAQIAGIDNGNPRSLNPFQSNTAPLFYGKAMVILRATENGGKVEIEAQANGLEKGNVNILFQ